MTTHRTSKMTRYKKLESSTISIILFFHDSNIPKVCNKSTTYIYNSVTTCITPATTTIIIMDKLYSGLAEAYGVLTALSFLQHYIQHFPTTYHSPPRIYVCCDNQGMITCINNHHEQPLNPNHTLFDQYGVFHVIHSTTHDLAPLQIRYIHVHGHQDTRTKNKPLPLEAKLNIECDKAATKLHTTLTADQYPNHHPFIPSAHPYLTIQGNHIIHHVKQQLCDAYTTHPYTEYLIKKYKWTPQIPNTIAWHALHIAIDRFKASEQQIIQKFIHGWLPLQTRPQVTSTSTDKLCPSCKHLPEDMQHFLSCSHPSRKPAFQDLQRQVLKLHQKHNCEPTVYQILWQGLTSILLQHDLIEPHKQYTQQQLRLFQAQECIGWMQLLNGRYTSEWITIVNDQGINGTIFYAKVIELSWKYVLTSWKECNRALHDTAKPYDMSQMHITVQQIFHDAAQHPHTEATIRDQTFESILARPLRSIASWAVCSALHIRDHVKAAATRACIQNTDIHSFFRPRPPPGSAPPTDLRPP